MDLVFRAAAVFFFIFLITRIAGRRELSSLEPFDLILLVVLGDLVQQSITQSDESVTGALIVISTITLFSVGVSWVSFRSGRIRLITEGEPIVLVQDGQIVERNLRRERLTHGDVEQEARAQQISSLGDVRWAILEKVGQDRLHTEILIAQAPTVRSTLAARRSRQFSRQESVQTFSCGSGSSSSPSRTSCCCLAGSLDSSASESPETSSLRPSL